MAKTVNGTTAMADACCGWRSGAARIQKTPPAGTEPDRGAEEHADGVGYPIPHVHVKARELSHVLYPESERDHGDQARNVEDGTQDEDEDARKRRVAREVNDLVQLDTGFVPAHQARNRDRHDAAQATHQYHTSRARRDVEDCRDLAARGMS